MHFESLRGAAREAAEVAGLWKQWERPRGDARRRDANRGDAKRGDARRVPDAVQLEGVAASEAAFKAAAPGKRVLHLATHGFFLGGRCPSAAAAAGESRARAISSGDALPRVAGENPLLLSGLALAGANRRAAVAAGEEDGILTAEEIAGLDLRGVEIVVLSACDTGVGEVKAGEGVLGLRRAFAVAGVRTVIMSLWPVDDRTAPAWMRALYAARWARGLETAEAVRAADLELLGARREKGLSTHPYYWAGFIAAGD
jgi:CHAT domain-containing protein